MVAALWLFCWGGDGGGCGGGDDEDDGSYGDDGIVEDDDGGGDSSCGDEGGDDSNDDRINGSVVVLVATALVMMTVGVLTCVVSGRSRVSLSLFRCVWKATFPSLPSWTVCHVAKEHLVIWYLGQCHSSSMIMTSPVFLEEELFELPPILTSKGYAYLQLFRHWFSPHFLPWTCCLKRRG